MYINTTDLDCEMDWCLEKKSENCVKKLSLSTTKNHMSHLLFACIFAQGCVLCKMEWCLGKLCRQNNENIENLNAFNIVNIGSVNYIAHIDCINAQGHFSECEK